jgi:hypothetical protein
MNRLVIYFILAAILVSGNSCNKTVATNDVVQIILVDSTVPADASSSFRVYALLPLKATAASRTVLFSASSGTFANHKDTIYAFADSIGVVPGMWAAAVTYTAPLKSGQATISVSTPTAPVFTAASSVTLTPALPDSMALNASSFMVQDSFQSEITITGTLFSGKGKKVSTGSVVKFSDYYADNDSAVRGSYRALQILSDTASSFSCIYSPGPVPVTELHRYLYVKAIVVGNTAVNDSVKIYISQ